MLLTLYIKYVHFISFIFLICLQPLWREDWKRMTKVHHKNATHHTCKDLIASWRFDSASQTTNILKFAKPSILTHENLSLGLVLSHKHSLSHREKTKYWEPWRHCILLIIHRPKCHTTNIHHPHTTLFVVFSVTYYLELYCAITFYYWSRFLPTKVKLFVWTLNNINIFAWWKLYNNDKIL